MATASFKSTSRRGATTEPKAPPPAASSRRRSHSVSAASRKTHVPFDDKTLISTEFSYSRDNPLFWSRSSSPQDAEESGRMNGTATSSKKLSSKLRTDNGNSNSTCEQRGRSVTRSRNNGNGIGRSLSRVRRQSVSAASRNGVYESEKEQVTSAISQSRNEAKRVSGSINGTSSVRNRVNKPGQAKHAGIRRTKNQATEWSEDDSACSLQISNLEDGISVCSLSESEEQTIRTAFEELNAFRRNNPNQAAPATDVADKLSNFVNSNTVELMSDTREYAIKLEESEERARKLRADLAIEEHRGQELDRILKKIVPDPETSDMQSQRSRRGRRTRSSERKWMSKRLTEEAMAYFDESVSLSPFDSSDFSASEDPAYSLVGAAAPVGTPPPMNRSPSTLCCYDQGILVDHKKICGDPTHLKHCKESGPTTNISSASPFYQFSFADKKAEHVRPQEDIISYIEKFERKNKTDIDLEDSNTYYDADEYSIQGHIEGVLLDRVLYKSRIESGGLLLCGGAFSSLPFASVL